MISISELKKKALSQLKGNWTNPVITTLVFFSLAIAASLALCGMAFALTWVLSIPINFIIKDLSMTEPLLEAVNGILSTIVSFLLMPLCVGFINYFLMFSKSHKPDIVNLFDGHKKSFPNSVIAGLLVEIYVILWSLLLIIPGIIKSYSYSMTFFIIADEPNISANEAITKSRAMMNGYKWKYFLLQLSFIGWGLLATFTCGIGYIWLYPYMQLASTHFYLTVKEAYENKNSTNDNPLILEQF